MSLKASSSIADRKIENRVGASTNPCLTPFVIANHPSIPDVHHQSGMQTFYHGCELFGASIFRQQLPQSSPPNVIECLREVDNLAILNGRKGAGT